MHPKQEPLQLFHPQIITCAINNRHKNSDFTFIAAIYIIQSVDIRHIGQ